MTARDDFFALARERYRIKLRQDAVRSQQTYLRDPGEPAGKELTYDPIFKQFRFCNVFREDDKVTTWFREEIRDPLGPRRLMQFRAAVVFRWFNNIETGKVLQPFLMDGCWDHSRAKYAVGQMQERGERILNPAYMIKSPPGMNKTEGLFECIDNVMNDDELICTEMMEGASLQKAHALLQRYPYLGPFMAYQMICDLRFTGVLGHSTDIDTWTAPGPGSARGIGRMFFDDPAAFNYNSEKDQLIIVDKMRELLESADPKMNYWPANWPRWELSTVQHWCCEYDKYERFRLGEGKPKQRYNPAK